MSMKTVHVVIQGKDYSLACDSGQEAHLLELVEQFRQRADQLTREVGKLSDPLMMLYTALMFADELHDAKRENIRLRDENSRIKRAASERGEEARIAALEEGMAESLQALAGRIEGLAEKLAA